MKPILFNTEMVRAILDGRKTQTRRILAEKIILDKEWGLDREPYFKNGKWYYDKQTAVDGSKCYELKPKYQVGDILWVRETFGKDKYGKYHYRAEYPEHDCQPYPIWHPSIHMPREAARIFLRVTNARVERLQDITPFDAWNEGCHIGNSFPWEEHISELQQQCRNIVFKVLWDSTIKKQDLVTYGWNANPWVWVIEFERVVGE